jgi:hypothetical protein
VGTIVSVLPSIRRLYTAARSTSGQYATAICFPPSVLFAISCRESRGTEYALVSFPSVTPMTRVRSETSFPSLRTSESVRGVNAFLPIPYRNPFGSNPWKGTSRFAIKR